MAVWTLNKQIVVLSPLLASLASGTTTGGSTGGQHGECCRLLQLGPVCCCMKVNGSFVSIALFEHRALPAVPLKTACGW